MFLDFDFLCGTIGQYFFPLILRMRDTKYKWSFFIAVTLLSALAAGPFSQIAQADDIPYPWTIDVESTELGRVQQGDHKYSNIFADEPNSTWQGNVLAFIDIKRKAFLSAECPTGYDSKGVVFTQRKYRPNTLFIARTEWNPAAAVQQANALDDRFDWNEQEVTDYAFDALRRQYLLHYKWRTANFSTTHKLTGAKTGQDYRTGTITFGQWQNSTVAICEWPASSSSSSSSSSEVASSSSESSSFSSSESSLSVGSSSSVWSESFSSFGDVVSASSSSF
jgi:hypothetical protein